MDGLVVGIVVVVLAVLWKVWQSRDMFKEKQVVYM
jgi:hypothetical protein